MTVNSFVTLFVLILITPLIIVVATIWSIVDPSGNGSHLAARAWARILLWTSLVRVQVIGGEELDPGESYVFVANHTSAYDILVLLAYLPFQFRWLAKEELFKIPFFGWAMARVGYIPINRSNPRESARSLIKAAEKIKAGVSVVIFPEGTRSRDGLIHEFKRGSFTLAVRSGRPLVPVSISGTHRILPTKTLR
ncbi:MAG: lysophospholipid acyltransferase family protein, partial [Thermodesulfobacteriota bacterium]|nr:lysophospholipid acyltransferase family protein [Thermodesulfobacteriota bacterium]